MIIPMEVFVHEGFDYEAFLVIEETNKETNSKTRSKIKIGTKFRLADLTREGKQDIGKIDHFPSKSITCEQCERDPTKYGIRFRLQPKSESGAQKIHKSYEFTKPRGANITDTILSCKTDANKVRVNPVLPYF